MLQWRATARSLPIRHPLLVSVARWSALPGAAGAHRVELGARAGFPNVTAEARIGGGASRGTAFDFERDLGIGDQPLADIRLALLTGPHSRLRLAYALAQYEGDTILDRGIEFNGTLYPAAARVVSQLDVHYARLGWIWQPALIPERPSLDLDRCQSAH